MGLKMVLAKGLWKRVAVILLAAAFWLVGSAFTLVDEDDLPRVARWKNGMAVDANGVYLADTWAVDDTGVSDSRYVLLGQGCTEEMRVAEYPEDVTNGDTTVCERHNVTVSLDLPEGVTGDVVVTFENEVALYSVRCSEDESYLATAAFYPGVYEVANIEVMDDPDGAYLAKDAVSVDAASEPHVALEVVASEDETAGGNGTTIEGSNEGSNGKDYSDKMAEKNHELLVDTVKLAIAVVVLMSVYMFIKYRRERSEEMKG